jgi:hypothetical protein
MSLFRRTAQQAPERILRAINRPRRDSAEAFLHAWTDTQQVPLAAFPMHYLLPPGAIQCCHLIGSGLDCQVPLSEAAWRLQSEQQAVRCGLPVTRGLLTAISR